MTGTGVGPEASLSATSLGFGNQRVGTSSDGQVLTVSNQSYKPLTVTVNSVTISGAAAGDFAVSAAPALGTPFDQDHPCRADRRLHAHGARATGRGADDRRQQAGSPRTVTLSGNGTAPALKVSPGSLDFGRQLVGPPTARRR